MLSDDLLLRQMLYGLPRVTHTTPASRNSLFSTQMIHKAMESETEDRPGKETAEENQSLSQAVYTDDEWDPSPEETNKRKYACHPWFRDYKHREELMDRRNFIFTLDQFVDGYCHDLVDKVCRDEYIWREMKRIEMREKAASDGQKVDASEDTDWLTEDEIKRRNADIRHLVRTRNPGPCFDCVDAYNRRNGIIDASKWDTIGDKNATGENTLVNPGYGMEEDLLKDVRYTSILRSSPIESVLGRKNYPRKEVPQVRTRIPVTNKDKGPRSNDEEHSTVEESTAAEESTIAETGETAVESKRKSAMGRKIRAFFRQFKCNKHRATTEAKETEL